MSTPGHESDWALWMRAAFRGDKAAYRRFFVSVAPSLRGMARRHGPRFGLDARDIEDAVQDALLTIHIKRQTWDETRPITPWIASILRNKLIDAYRRRRSRPVEVSAEALFLAAPAIATDELEFRELDRMISRLDARDSDLIRSISLEGQSIAEVARRLDMKEGAVRVALHRAIKSLARLYRIENR